MTHIVIADDHPVVRQGLKALLEMEPDFKVVGEAGDGREAIDLVERLDPDVLVLDIVMPSMNGVEVAQVMRDSSTRTKIVMLSMHATEAYFLSALRSNVDSYILKDESGSTLVQAIHEVINGRRFLSPSLTEKAIDAYLRANKDDPEASREYAKLTSRERDIVKLIVEGHTNASIASRLAISQRTVETHRANIMHKLNLTCQADLLRFAVHCGILQ